MCYLYMSYFEEYFKVIFIPRKCSVVQGHLDGSAWLQLKQDKLMTILPEDFLRGKTGHSTDMGDISGGR